MCVCVWMACEGWQGVQECTISPCAASSGQSFQKLPQMTKGLESNHRGTWNQIGVIKELAVS